ncbi:MAG: Hsp20/alpha crystallin family protein [Planctomycetota bacterium]
MNQPVKTTPTEAPRQLHRPDIDLLESEHEITVIADLPGVRSQDIQIDYREGALSIQATASKRLPENAKLRHRESLRGDYYREFRIGNAIDADGIQAEYNSGVLTLHLPKTPSHRPRQIPVQITNN